MDLERKLKKEEYLRILEALVNKILTEEEIHIGLAGDHLSDYSFISWDWHYDEMTIELMYNGVFYLQLAYWNTEGLHLSQTLSVLEDDISAIPEGLTILMDEVYRSKKAATFYRHTLT